MEMVRDDIRACSPLLSSPDRSSRRGRRECGAAGGERDNGRRRGVDRRRVHCDNAACRGMRLCWAISAMAHFLVDQRAETEKTVLASCDESGVGNRWLDGGSNLPMTIINSPVDGPTALTGGGCWILSGTAGNEQTSDGEGGRG